MRKIIIFLIIIIIIGYFAYGRFFGMPPGMGMPGGAPPVGVAEATERNVQQWHEFSGRLVAVDQVDIRPRVSGTVMKVHFANGAMVKKDQMLFTIDPRPFQAALQSAQARATLAASELKRAQDLLAEKAIPQRQFDERKNAAEVARADLTTARLNLDYTQIKSPIDGKAGRAEITEGNLVEAGNAPILTTVVSLAPIYADFEVDEDTFLRYVASGATGKDTKEIPVVMGLANESDMPHVGHIESFDNKLNVASGTVRVRAVFANDDGALVPGLFARLRLGSAGQEKVVLIADRAVGTDQNKKFVLVVGGDNKVAYREVKLGGLVDGLRVVEEGLAAGETIVVDGLQRARPGTPVTPQPAAMDGKDAPPKDAKEP